MTPVLAAAALMAVPLGSRSSMGLFVGPINTATALGAATVSFAFAASQLAWGAAQPVAGLLARRHGTTRVVVAGGALLLTGAVAQRVRAEQRATALGLVSAGSSVAARLPALACAAAS